MAASPATPDLLWAGSPNAILYRSRDAGESWTHLPFPAEQASTLHALLPHPADAARLLAAVSPDSGGSGLFLSIDGGAAWRGVAAFQDKAVWALAHFPADPRVMVAAASDGVYRSGDAGETWNRISSERDGDLKPAVSVAIHPSRAEIVYAGTPHLPWKTVNGGRSWQSIHAGMLDDSDVFSIDVNLRDPARVFASACSGIYRSLVGGAAWTKLRGSADASFRTYIIAQDPHAAGRVWAGTTHGLMRSADSGLTWRTVSPHSVKSIAFDQRHPGTLYLATRDAGLLKSVAAGPFTAVNRGFANRGFFALAAAGGSLWLAGEGAGTWKSGDGGRKWDKSTESERILAISACQADSLFAAGPGFLRQWTAGTGTWTALSEPRREAVRSVACPGGAASESLFAVSSRAAYASRDHGKTWTPLAPPAGPPVEWNQITASPASGTVMAATSHGLLRSMDAGQTWTPAAGELGEGTVSSVLFHPERPGHAFAAQYDRIFVSSGDGLGWKPLAAQGLERAAIRALAIAKGWPGRLYALVAGRGVFSIDLE